MRIKKKIYLCMILLGFLFSGCEKAKPQKNNEAEVIPVRVSEIKLQELQDILEYVGNIKAQDEAIVYPKVSGKIIEKLKEDGSAVAKGEVIAYIDRDEVGLQFEKAPIDCPLSGTIGRVYVDLGQNVTTQSEIALVVDMDKVEIDLDIPEKYLEKVAVGKEAKVTVDAYPEEEFSGRITKVSPVVDLQTRSAPVEITIDNPGHRLKSGMFAKVRLVIAQAKQAPVILREALIGKDSDAYVFVIENNKAALKKIVLGLRQGPYFEVKEGLKEGDEVVIMGQQRLAEGSSVTVEKE